MKKLLLISAAFAVLLAPAMAAEKPVRVHKRVRPVVVAAPRQPKSATAKQFSKKKQKPVGSQIGGKFCGV